MGSDSAMAQFRGATRSGCRAALPAYVLVMGLLCAASIPKAHGQEQATFAVAATDCVAVAAGQRICHYTVTCMPASTVVTGYNCKQQALVAATDLDRILKASHYVALVLASMCALRTVGTCELANE